MPEAYARCVDGFAIGPQSLACALALLDYGADKDIKQVEARAGFYIADGAKLHHVAESDT
jgi:hypothetical protein